MRDLPGSRLDIEMYIKDECHLCESMKDEVLKYIEECGLQDAVTMHYNDIDDSTEWYRLYREYVPLIVVNSEEICHYFFDRQALRDILVKNGIQVGNT